MRRGIVGWCVMLVVLALSTPAVAHVETAFPPVETTTFSLETLSAATPSMGGFWTLVAAMAIAVALLGRHRRGVAIASTALLLFVAFEAGVHSVHHLADQPDGQCAVASASAHTGAVAVEGPAFERPAEAATTIAVAPTALPSARPAAPHLGRAPPTV